MTRGPQEADWDAYPPGAVPPPGHVPPAYGLPPGHVPPAYGPPPGHVPPAYGLPPGHVPPAYGLPPGHVPSAYGPPPGHGLPSGYGPQAYGPPPGYGWFPVEPPAWPDGPGRPGVATAAAVLGFVTAGLTILVSGGFLIAVLAGEDDAVALLLALGLPCAAALIAGGVRLLARRPPTLLLGAALASVAVLVLAWVAGALSIDRSGGLSELTSFLLAAGVLPVVTAVFAGLATVRDWAAARPG